MKDATLDAGGALWFKEKIYVLQVGYLICEVLFEAYGLNYSIYLSITKMYHDLR